MKFQAACSLELEEKIRNHKCHKTNKRVGRTAELRQSIVKSVVQDKTVNRIEQHNFDRLVERGMIVRM